jgi:hypothetical protein
VQRLSVEEQSAILDEEVRKYVRRGYRVESRTATTAQMLKPKKFSFFWAFVWFLLFGVGVLVYLFYYWSKRDETAYLEVDGTGTISVS